MGKSYGPLAEIYIYIYQNDLKGENKPSWPFACNEKGFLSPQPKGYRLAVVATALASIFVNGVQSGNNTLLIVHVYKYLILSKLH